MTDRFDDVLEIDEIDRRILEILANDPRSPYADIADELAEYSIELSSEGVLRRVTSLLENMTSFFLPRPERNSWEIVLVTAQVADEAGSKREGFEAMWEMDFWFVAEGIDTIDIYGIATSKSNAEIGDLLVQLRALKSVVAVDTSSKRIVPKILKTPFQFTNPLTYRGVPRLRIADLVRVSENH